MRHRTVPAVIADDDHHRVGLVEHAIRYRGRTPAAGRWW
jgi:hypothetical protein